MEPIRNQRGATRALHALHTLCLLFAALWMGACAGAPMEGDGQNAYDEEEVAGTSEALTLERTKVTEPLLIPQVSFSDLGKEPEAKREVDANGCIASANGKRVALSVDEVFEAYAPTKDSGSTARLAGGGFGMRGNLGGLSAWGCWTGSCCASGRYVACATGWCWVCESWRDCERCIWPW